MAGDLRPSFHTSTRVSSESVICFLRPKCPWLVVLFSTFFFLFVWGGGGAPRSCKWVLVPLESELLAVVSCLVWVLRTEHRASARAASPIAAITAEPSLQLSNVYFWGRKIGGREKKRLKFCLNYRTTTFGYKRILSYCPRPAALW